MATLNAVLVPAKVLVDGRHKIRIAIAHNGQTRYIVTNIIIDSEKEFKNGAIVKRPDAAILNTKLRGLIQRYQDAVDEVEFVNGLTCPELVTFIKHSNTAAHRTLGSIYQEYIENTPLSNGSRSSYAIIWSTLSKHLSPTLMLEHINYATVIGTDKFLRKRGLKPVSLRNYMVLLLTLVNYAKRCGYVQYRVDPFASYTFPQMTVRQCWLAVEEVKRIRDFQTTNKRLQRCRDLFMLSYYLGGINMADLLFINFNEQQHTIRYIRKKTANRQKINKYVEFEIPDEAQSLIAKYKGDDGYIISSQNERDHSMVPFFGKHLRELANAAHIPYLVYYSARKSFSQHAFQLGINTPVIDYILGHKVDKGGTSLYSYISVTPDMATQAVRKVLDNLK